MFIWSIGITNAQNGFPHAVAHAHNDYEHKRPLLDALSYGFISVEADVHLKDGQLKVAHYLPGKSSRTLTELYLRPLDSLLTVNNGTIYPEYRGTFYLMIDYKTESESTYRELQAVLKLFPRLLCTTTHCPVTIYISGNRPVAQIITTGYQGLALDGRPDDLGKGYSSEVMPVISDTYSKWSSWKGKEDLKPEDLDRIRDLSERVHAEGKKLRLWAIPDNEKAWEALLAAGVDLINTDKLQELHSFLQRKGM